MKKEISASLKLEIAIEALKGDMPLKEIASKYGISSRKVSYFKKHLLQKGSSVFEEKKLSKTGQRSIFQKLYHDYFQPIANSMSNDIAISSLLFPHISDVGDIRENILLRFLQSHIPLRCTVVKGGYIFNSLGEKSGQIDLLVVNDGSIRFSYLDRDSGHGKNFQTVEACFVAISVKSTLNKKELEDALQNLASIPAMPENILKKVSHAFPEREDYPSFPKKIIFAFSSAKELSVEKIQKHTEDFYNKNSYKEAQKVDLIAVNNVSFLRKTSQDEKNKGASDYTGGSREKEENFGAVPLLLLLNHIAYAAAFSPHILIDCSEYFTAIQSAYEKPNGLPQKNEVSANKKASQKSKK